MPKDNKPSGWARSKAKAAAASNVSSTPLSTRYNVNPNGGDVLVYDKSNQNLIDPYGSIVIPASSFEAYAQNTLARGSSILKVTQNASEIANFLAAAEARTNAWRAKKRGRNIGL